MALKDEESCQNAEAQSYTPLTPDQSNRDAGERLRSGKNNIFEIGDESTQHNAMNSSGDNMANVNKEVKNDFEGALKKKDEDNAEGNNEGILKNTTESTERSKPETGHTHKQEDEHSNKNNTSPATSSGATSVSSSVPTAATGPPGLLTISQEIRDIIYSYVFADPQPSVQEPGKVLPRERDDPVTMVTVPASIKLGDASPSSRSLDPILPCRQLYTEMKDMRAKAYNSYWTENRFITPNIKGAEGYCDTWGDRSALTFHIRSGPVKLANATHADLQRIQHWALPLEQGHCFHPDLVQGKWQFWVLAKDYETLPPARFTARDFFVTWNKCVMARMVVQTGRVACTIRDLNECLANGMPISGFMTYIEEPDINDSIVVDMGSD